MVAHARAVFYSSNVLSRTTNTNDQMVKQLVDTLLRRVELAGGKGKNIVAFSGGVDSSLVAALVNRVFPDIGVACIGKSAALPTTQLTLAREVATIIGIELQEVETAERQKPGYVANNGSAVRASLHLVFQVSESHPTAPNPRTLYPFWKLL